MTVSEKLKQIAAWLKTLDGFEETRDNIADGFQLVGEFVDVELQAAIDEVSQKYDEHVVELLTNIATSTQDGAITAEVTLARQADYMLYNTIGERMNAMEKAIVQLPKTDFDLNTITKSGLYGVNFINATILNRPCEMIGIMRVTGNPISNSADFIQEVVGYQPNAESRNIFRMWRDYRKNQTPNWSEWQTDKVRIVTADPITNPALYAKDPVGTRYIRKL